jgi:tetratricopeptide (TPR) repeat protein
MKALLCLPMIVWSSALLATVLMPAGEATEASSPETNETLRQADAALEIKGLLIVAHNAANRRAWNDAEAAYHKILVLPVPDAAKHDALLEMGRMFEIAKAYAKAAMVYEGFLERFRDDPAAADVSIRLGRACRELGAFQTALEKFYNALHSSLRVTGDNAVAAQRQLALKAQFEIAETHFAKGDYAEAKRFFARLLLLDMTAEDRELVEFRLAATNGLLGDPGEAAALARGFLNDHADSERSADAHYLLAQSLQKLGRSDEAAKETLKLLKIEKPREKETPEVWRRWKMKTGAELASALYEKGDAMNALTIYQRLADLDARPEWRWPIVYQIGLCFERLRLTQRALEAYAYLANGELPKTADKDSTIADLPALKEMAQWKMEYVRWAADVDHSLSKILKPDWKTAAIQPLKFRETPVSPVELPSPTPQ